MVLFALGCLAVLVLGPLVVRRLFAGPPLPPPLAPTLALGVAAPALVSNTYLVIAGGFDAVAWALVGVTTVGALVQIAVPRALRPRAVRAADLGLRVRLRDDGDDDAAGDRPRAFSEGDALRWTILAAITGLLATLSV